MHQISADETLPEISHVYGVELMDILAANQITDPAFIRPGTRIWIPGGDPKKWAKEEERVAQVTEMEERAGPAQPQVVKKPVPAKAKVENAPKVSGKKISANDVSGEFAWPAEGNIVSGFGKRKEKMHNGVDIRVRPGGPIRAASAGEVVYRGHDVAGYGDLIILKHRNRLFTVYGYLGTISAAKGASVARGEVIATASQDPSKAFIHFEIRQAKTALDPEKWIATSLKK